MTQLTISLDSRPSFAAEDYVLSNSNQAAYNTLMQWPNWPDYGLWLYGPARAGKSHLASIWAQKAGAAVVSSLSEALSLNQPLLLDSVPSLQDATNADDLFHLLNHVKHGGVKGRILLVSEHSPAQTPCSLPDLASRIKALPTAQLPAPDDTLLQAVWFKAFADKQLQVSPAVIEYLCAHCERSFAAIHELALQLDRAALAQKRAVTIPLIKSLLRS